MKGRLLAAALALALAPSFVRAASSSLLTAGIGTGIGILRTVSGAAAPTCELIARGWALRSLGLELSYNLTGLPASDSGLVYDSRVRASALVRIVPTYPVGGFLKMGLGNRTLFELFSVSGEDASYHAGGGVDLHLFRRVVLSGELLVLFPGVRSVVAAAVPSAAPLPGESVTGRGTRGLPSGYLGVRNFRALLAGMVYL